MTDLPPYVCGSGPPPHDAYYSKLDHTHAGGSGMGYAIGLTALLLSAMTDLAGYYFGNVGIAPGTVSDVARVYVPKAGRIKAVFVFWRAGTAGTSETINFYLRKNGTTDYFIASISDASAVKVFSNVALDVEMAQGDYFEIKFVCPAWATNPAAVRLSGNVYLE